MQTRFDEVGTLLEQTCDANPRVRTRAVVHLCPCHVKRNRDDIWDRLLTMADDPDAGVRNAVLHVLTDGSPRERQAAVVQVLERLHHDPERKLRRKARHILAHYRRTGEWNIS